MLQRYFQNSEKNHMQKSETGKTTNQILSRTCKLICKLKVYGNSSVTIHYHGVEV